MPSQDRSISNALASIGKTTPQRADAPEGNPPQADSYFENGLLVYTAAYHVKRGQCCGSGCRHCPFEPRHIEGATKVRA